MKKANFFYLLRRGFFGGGGEWASLVNAFKTRVIADGGTLESESCIRDDVKYLIQNPEPVAFTGLLNDYSGAAAAYSLRLLDNTYTGDAIVVRRASDNTTQSIGFVNNELDTATLESFCSGTDGFVTTWYDQSGNANNATQATASAQPQIVSSGSTILDGTKPAIDFAFTQYITTIGNGGDYPQPNTYFIAASATGGSSDFVDAVDQSKRNLIDYGGGVLRMYAGNVFSSTFPFVSGQRELKYALFNGTNSEISVNGATNQTGNPSTMAMDSAFDISDTTSVIKMQEFILYNSNESANQSGIETNINTYYSIY